MKERESSEKWSLLSESFNDQFSLFLENMTEAVVVVQDDSRLALWNDNFLQLTGYSELDLKGKEIPQLIHETDRGMVAEHMAAVQNGDGLYRSSPFRIMMPGGTV